ncbi:LysR family transcriptional regulator [Niveibacterium umoris]|uniref:DNA-binding transcriptional LysR family regulator n=1 Tax=Niveibacterium umoris TaxID=1193620 RepID=A0A840BH81_9RHOO|nr:LysR family transcriptional regulator [Niveibacterium umoris]MBB4010962.1 DNA-binding transcriptional LysR family regulator [Niveibacterium umoris]
MSVFTKVVELGSFAAAAEHLKLSTSAVSRLVAQLEALLDARLLHRTTRRLSLTDNGRAYYERCVQLLADIAEAEELAGSRDPTPRGTLRLTAPISFGISHLAPAIAAYLANHPGVRVDVSLSDRQVDLVEEGLDLAIRVGEVGSQTLVARPIGEARLMIAAAPAYLAAHGIPHTPADLAQHACLTYAYSSEGLNWVFLGADGERIKVPVRGPAHANNGPMLAELAAQGLGLTGAPDFILQPLLDSGRLVEVLTDWRPKPLTIYAVYPTRRHLSAAVRSFVSHLTEWLVASCPTRSRAGATPQ